VFLEEWVKAKYEREEFTATERGAQHRQGYLLGRREGILLKKGKGNDKWAPRWCVLAEGHFSYYLQKGDAAPKDRIPIEDAVLSVRRDRAPKAVPLSLALIHNERMYFFAAEGNSTDYVDWVNAIRAAKALALGISDLEDVSQNVPEVGAHTYPPTHPPTHRFHVAYSASPVAPSLLKHICALA